MLQICWVQAMLTLSGSNFYITTPWASRYRVVKNCNTLIDAATNTTLATDAQKKAYTGFAKTIEAYQLLMNLKSYRFKWYSC